jgi:hypothetical protein
MNRNQDDVDDIRSNGKSNLRSAKTTNTPMLNPNSSTRGNTQ